MVRAIGILGGGLLALAGAAQATTISYPYIDVIETSGDAGVSATGSIPTLTMQGTAASIVSGPGEITNLGTPATFTLTASYSAALSAADGQPNTYDYTDGAITVGSSGATPLLTATFQDLVLQSAGTSLYNYVISTSALDYTGGTLAGNLTGGELLGSFTILAAAATNGAGYADLSQDFSGSNLTAKIGAVVPLPATLSLLLPGIALLTLIRRRDAHRA